APPTPFPYTTLSRSARLARPRPALAHLVPRDAAALTARAEHPQGLLLAHPPLRALDELEDPDRPALVPCPKSESEGRRRLPLHRSEEHTSELQSPYD